MQLQTKSGSERVYTGMWQTMGRVWSSDGFRGLEKGLSVAVVREGSKNFFRIGLFQPVSIPG